MGANGAAKAWQRAVPWGGRLDACVRFSLCMARFALLEYLARGSQPLGRVGGQALTEGRRDPWGTLMQDVYPRLFVLVALYLYLV